MSKSFLNGVVVFVVGAIVGAGLTYHSIKDKAEQAQASMVGTGSAETQAPAMPAEAAAPAPATTPVEAAPAAAPAPATPADQTPAQ